MIRTRFFNVVAAILAIPSLFGAARFDNKVRDDFFAGFAGDKEAFARAMKMSEEAIASSPKESAEAMSWHGSGLLFLSGAKFQAGDYAGGGELWGKGMTEMETAGKMEPDSVAVLIPRAAAWFAASRNMPAAQQKPIIEKAIADYEHVYDLQKGSFDNLGIHPRSELLFGLADGYARLGNQEKAHGYFDKLAALGPKSGHLTQAQAYLDSGKYTVTGIGCAGCHTGK